MKRYFNVCFALILAALLCLPALPALATESIGLDVSIPSPGSGRISLSWDSVPGVQHYAYSVRDVTTGEAFASNETTSKTSARVSGTWVAGHEYRVWAGACCEGNDPSNTSTWSYTGMTTFTVEGCAHKHTEIGWDTDHRIKYKSVSDSEHEVIGYQYEYCTDCFEHIGDSFKVTEVEPHDFKSNGDCRICDYTYVCPHKNTEYVRLSGYPAYNEYNEDEHTVNIQYKEVCSDCDEVLRKPADDAREYYHEAHNFNSKGICKQCDFVKPEKQDPLSISVGANQSQVEVGSTISASATAVGGTGTYSFSWRVTCNGGTVASTDSSYGSSYNITTDQPGTYQFSATVTDSNGNQATSSSGSINVTPPACDHTLISTGIKEGTPTYTSLDDNTHNAVYHMRYTCSCGEKSELRDEPYTEKHVYENGISCVCGHVKCDHTLPEKGMMEGTPTYSQIDNTKHLAIYHMRYICACGAQNVPKDETYEEAHVYVNGKCVCGHVEMQPTSEPFTGPTLPELPELTAAPQPTSNPIPTEEPHQHEFVLGIEKEHIDGQGHRYYEQCACGETRYTGEYGKLDGCEKCHPTPAPTEEPHQHEFVLGIEKEHIDGQGHRYYEQCACSEIRYTGEYGKLDGCEKCHSTPAPTSSVGEVMPDNPGIELPDLEATSHPTLNPRPTEEPHQHEFVQGIEKEHIDGQGHRYYEQCACSETRYTGEYGKLDGCEKCYPKPDTADVPCNHTLPAEGVMEGTPTYTQVNDSIHNAVYHMKYTCPCGQNSVLKDESYEEKHVYGQDDVCVCGHQKNVHTHHFEKAIVDKSSYTNLNETEHSVATTYYTQCNGCGEKTNQVTETVNEAHNYTDKGRIEAEHHDGEGHKTFDRCVCGAAKYTGYAPYKNCCKCQGHAWQEAQKENNEWRSYCGNCGQYQITSAPIFEQPKNNDANDSFTDDDHCTIHIWQDTYYDSNDRKSYHICEKCGQKEIVNEKKGNDYTAYLELQDNLGEGDGAYWKRIATTANAYLASGGGGLGEIIDAASGGGAYLYNNAAESRDERITGLSENSQIKVQIWMDIILSIQNDDEKAEKVVDTVSNAVDLGSLATEPALKRAAENAEKLVGNRQSVVDDLTNALNKYIGGSEQSKTALNAAANAKLQLPSAQKNLEIAQHKLHTYNGFNKVAEAMPFIFAALKGGVQGSEAAKKIMEMEKSYNALEEDYTQNAYQLLCVIKDAQSVNNIELEYAAQSILNEITQKHYERVNETATALTKILDAAEKGSDVAVEFLDGVGESLYGGLTAMVPSVGLMQVSSWIASYTTNADEVAAQCELLSILRDMSNSLESVNQYEIYKGSDSKHYTSEIWAKLQQLGDDEAAELVDVLIEQHWYNILSSGSTLKQFAINVDKETAKGLLMDEKELYQQYIEDIKSE